MNNLTLVTGLFDIGRGDINEGFSRSFDHYLECFEKLLAVDLPMVVYTTSDIEEFVWKHRDRTNTRVVLKELKEFPFLEETNKIRNDEEWMNRSGWIPDSPQSSLEYYNPLVMSKQFWLNDATLFNFFDTKYFMWIDAGIANTIGNPTNHIHESFAKKVTKHMNKMLYVCFPYDGEVEVHGFEKKKLNKLAGQKTNFVARGGVFGGSKYAINEINNSYYRLLQESLSDGYMGTEESIFTILCHTDKQLVNTHMIESNGLVYKFFDDVNNEPEPQGSNDQLAIYVLTFNLPKQLSLWIESFKKAFPNDFNNVKKYLINNSTDPSVDEQYQKLISDNGFEEFKFDNIGICDGRHFAAEHFDQSEHSYMIFFEDDMLLHTENGKCKNGLSTYHSNLFDKCINIMEAEYLDFLKLSFSEFYGDNHDNWASYNVPADKMDLYFPHRDDSVSRRKTKIDYTGSYDGLSYAVGNYHYCNWPLLFNKKGNKAVFLNDVFEHKYEQTWMSLTMNMHWDKEIKAGCLLASPINHNRKYHYGKNTRRENKHYNN